MRPLNDFEHDGNLDTERLPYNVNQIKWPRKEGQVIAVLPAMMKFVSIANVVDTRSKVDTINSAVASAVPVVDRLVVVVRENPPVEER